MSAAAPRITALTVYPVKGCRGITLTRASTMVTGLAHSHLRDREWMVVDRRGHFVTQREYPRLALIQPDLASDALRLSADGAAALDVPLVASGVSRDVVVWRFGARAFDQGEAAAAWLSGFLRADVRLVRFDPAVSRRMRVDHGFTQALQLLWGSLHTPPVLPIFVNAVAPPSIPRVARCIELGRALGSFVGQLPGRTLLLGSGGLSHEPPVPRMDDRDPAVRERITVRSELTDEVRQRKITSVLAAGRALAAGDPAMKPLNAAWDARWMEAIARAEFAYFKTLTEDAITRDAGLSGHESKAWLIARAALPAGISGCAFRHYQAIDELIAGYGLMFVDGSSQQDDGLPHA